LAVVDIDCWTVDESVLHALLKLLKEGGHFAIERLVIERLDNIAI